MQNKNTQEFDEIIKDGKFPFFSNSYLVLLGERKQ